MAYFEEENPFKAKAYEGPSDFCDRVDETKRIISALENNRNLVLLSPRRLGKTGLIHHVFNAFDRQNAAQTYYVDILQTNNLHGFVNILSKTIINKYSSKTAKGFKYIFDFFSKLRPKICYDNLTNQPYLEFSAGTEIEGQATLEQIFFYLHKQNKKVILAIDEFQQVNEYPEKNTEACLRSLMQQYPQIGFIFSGSHKHIMLNMFTNQKRPFYQSSELMYLERIPTNAYLPFICQKFKEGKRTLPEELAMEILTWTRRHTFYVQYTCNRLYAANIKKIKHQHLIELYGNILKENEQAFINYRNLLTTNQFELLRAIAYNEGVEKPNSHEFISKYNIGAASTVSRALDALIAKEMAFIDEGKYQVYEVFFSRWLQYMIR